MKDEYIRKQVVVFIACGIAFALGYKEGMDTMTRIDDRIIKEAINKIYGEERDCERNSGKKDCEQPGRDQQKPWQDCDIPAEDRGDENKSADGADSAGTAGGDGRGYR